MAAKFEDVPPRPGALIEALRSVGYSLETAVADLIDNSITAGAANVWVDFHWAGAESWVRIIDDGRGMTEHELSEAMRAGGRNPLEERGQRDLGRFGLGLKTASFSQARTLVVASKCSGEVSARSWDLDYVGRTGEWRLLKEVDERTAAAMTLPPDTAGTVVLWQNLDRVVGRARNDDGAAHKHFLRKVESVQEHLAMVFHRYLEGSSPQLQIFINGRGESYKVKAWDPFLQAHPATYRTPPEVIGPVQLQGFVLPHRDRFASEEEYVLAAGPKGWSAQQGFYVYREARLLVAGGWLDLGYQNEEHYKLARIAVDIPNTVDHSWNIDVKKSRARPPSELRQRLRELANELRRRARDVFVHRGARQRRSAGAEPLVRPWRSHVKNGRQSYRVDRQHPVVAAVVASLNADERQRVDAMLRLLEETIPVQQIWLNVSENPDTHAPPFLDEASPEVGTIMRTFYEIFRKGGASPEQARHRLSLTDPFGSFPLLIEKLTD